MLSLPATRSDCFGCAASWTIRWWAAVVAVVVAVPNGLTVEYMPRLFPLWKAVPQPVNGMLEMPTAPGLGLEFDDAAIVKYRAE